MQILERKSEVLASHEQTISVDCVDKEVLETFNTQHTPLGSKMNDDDYSAIELGSDLNLDNSENLTPLSS